ncbi:MAG: InlB B-repeat-containing protein, partial [Oscillospiraceae bacterium]|nr:InlB B-repeat-containing protein [Oscillospiraceae bacterium]
MTSGFLAFVFCAYLALDVLPADAKAANIASGRLETNVYGKYLKWVIDGNGTLTISGEGDMGDIESDESHPFYSYISQIKKVVISEGITSVGSRSFAGLHNVTSVQLPSTLQRIGTFAFLCCCKLESIVIPEGVDWIQDYAFCGANALRSVSFPSTLETIGIGAFAAYDYESTNNVHHTYYPKFENIVIPENVQFIGDYAFFYAKMNSVIFCPETCRIGFAAFGFYSGNVHVSKIYAADPSIFVPLDGYTYWHFGEAGSDKSEWWADETKTYVIDATSGHYNAKHDANDTNYTEILGLYKATFKNYDGTILKEELVKEGDCPTPPADPARPTEGPYTYDFSGWTTNPFYPVYSDTVYIAQYDKKEATYTVRYTRDDGTLIKEDTHHYGDALLIPSAPTKDADNTYMYTFSKWKTTPSATCTGSATYVAQFAKTYRDYTITFEDHDGSVISTKKYHYGDSVVVPEAPVRPSDGYNTYVFAGWSAPVTAVAGNTTYTAVYRSTAEKYTVTFVDHDGTVISAGEYFYGDAITPPQDPVRASDAYADYIFRGWSLVPEAVKKDVTYTAQYIVIPKSYTVMYYNHDGRLLHLGSYHYGDVVHQPTVTSAPESENEKLYTYVHAGWGENFSETCTGSATYEAVFEKDYVEYDVTFVDYDGSILSAQTYHYGDAIAAPASPSRSADNTHSYTFAGWDKPVADTVTENVTYTAQYDAAYIEYEVSFKNYDGSTVAEQTYHYGDSLIVPPNPTRPSEGATGYAFLRWSPTLSPTVTSNVIYLAEYTTGAAEYTVSFLDHDAYVLSSDTYLWRDLVTIPPTPYRLDDDTYSYRFIGWSPGVVNYVDGNATYIAQYEKKYREYAVRFENYDGSELSSALYHWGDTIVVPQGPTRPSDGAWHYSFVGWDKEVAPLCGGDAVYTAQYKEVSVLYRVEFRDYDGTVLYLKTDCAYGDAITPPQDPVRAADATHSYTFAGWDNAVADTVTGDVVYTAAYTATPLLDTDGDGIPDVLDEDDDNDGIPDNEDPNPLVKDVDTNNSGSSSASSGGGGNSTDNTPPLTDTDGDGIPDILDEDDDNDGIPDSEDADPLVKDVTEPELPLLDTDGDGIPDELDDDDDNDGIPDSEDADPLVKDIAPPEEEAPVEEDPAQLVTEETTHSSEAVRPSVRPSGESAGGSSAAPPAEIGATKDITVTFLDYYGRKARQVMLSGRTLDEPITDDVAAPPPVDRLVVDNDKTYVFTGWD